MNDYGISFISRFDLGEKVLIDKHNLGAIITEVSFKDHELPIYEVTYFLDGKREVGYFNDWRLNKLETN